MVPLDASPGPAATTPSRMRRPRPGSAPSPSDNSGRMARQDADRRNTMETTPMSSRRDALALAPAAAVGPVLFASGAAQAQATAGRRRRPGDQRDRFPRRASRQAGHRDPGRSARSRTRRCAGERSGSASGSIGRPGRHPGSLRERWRRAAAGVFAGTWGFLRANGYIEERHALAAAGLWSRERRHGGSQQASGRQIQAMGNLMYYIRQITEI